MHVDGFRFDLASALGRSGHGVDFRSSFFSTIHQDPVLREVRLIAEPWDVGAGGYQAGRFPPPWCEWNDRYRDTVRAFWAGHKSKADELRHRLTGSCDRYAHNGRDACASVNFVTAHDGFTLRDLVSYEHKRNQANQENSRDGSDHNLAWNCGAEGPSADPEINALRARQQKNLLATLLLSQGTPMLTAGDEHGRTQRGNNNAYCQDNDISWSDWQWSDAERALCAFTRALIALRREVFATAAEVHWLRHDGAEMNDDDWHNPQTQSLALRHGDFLVVLNASPIGLSFALPEGDWRVRVDTFAESRHEVVRDASFCHTHALQVLQHLRQLPHEERP
jgi:glycogen operon protein